MHCLPPTHVLERVVQRRRREPQHIGLALVADDTALLELAVDGRDAAAEQHCTGEVWCEK